GAVLGNEQRMIGEDSSRLASYRLLHEAFDRLSRVLVYYREDPIQGLADSFVPAPTCKLFRHRIDVSHAALGVGRDDRVADAGESNPQEFRLLRDRALFPKDAPTYDVARTEGDKNSEGEHEERVAEKPSQFG